eukprot:2804695-Rhodomonas_salina.1
MEAKRASGSELTFQTTASSFFLKSKAPPRASRWPPLPHPRSQRPAARAPAACSAPARQPGRHTVRVRAEQRAASEGRVTRAAMLSWSSGRTVEVVEARRDADGFGLPPLCGEPAKVFTSPAASNCSERAATLSESLAREDFCFFCVASSSWVRSVFEPTSFFNCRSWSFTPEVSSCSWLRCNVCQYGVMA